MHRVYFSLGTNLGDKEANLRRAIYEIERELGRTKKSVGGVYSDRLIDIDLLLFDDRVIEDPILTIPHPLMCERAFVIEPMVEIAPEVIHPLTGKKLKDYM